MSTMDSTTAGQAESHPPMAIPLAMPVVDQRLPIIDLIIGVAIVWCVSIGIEFVIGFAVGLSVARGGGIEGGDSANPFMVLPPMLLMVLSILTAIFAAGVSWYFLCHRRGDGFAKGFKLRLPCPAWLPLGLVVGAGGAIVLTAMPTSENPNSLMARLVMTEDGLFVISILAVVVPPLEELYYRGFIFSFLRDRLGPVGTIAIVSIWFAAAHAFQLAGDWTSLFFVACMGAIWTYLRHASGSLLPSIVSHWLYNAMVIGFALGWIPPLVD